MPLNTFLAPFTPPDFDELATRDRIHRDFDVRIGTRIAAGTVGEMDAVRGAVGVGGMGEGALGGGPGAGRTEEERADGDLVRVVHVRARVGARALAC